jgi:predicted O-methyltransferase YrrM
MIGLDIESITRHFTGREATDWMLPLFWSVARKYPNVRVGEIGMRGATSTLAWLLAAREVFGRVWSMDIDRCERGLANIEASGFSDIHTFLQGDSRELEFPGPLDVLFIDGDHSYEGVVADYDRHVPRVRSGGVVFLHDAVSCEGVGRLCKEKNVFVYPLGAGLGIMPV